MKVLIISADLPHPRAGHGTGVVMYGLLKHFAPRHEVTLVSFCNKHELTLANETKELPLELIPVPRAKRKTENLFENAALAARRILQLLFSVVKWKPYYVMKYRQSDMAALVERLTTERTYDIVQCEMVHMGDYINYVRSGKTVWHEHDVAYRPAYRLYRKSKFFLKKFALFLEWCRWYRYESRMARRFDHVLCVTEQDRMLLRWLSGSDRVSYFPRGINVAADLPPYETREPVSLVFLGTFSHRPNIDAMIWMIEEILPLVKQRFPGVTLSIIGPFVPQKLHDLAAQYSNVKILGFVDDIEQYLRRFRIFVSPLRWGGGVKVKILQALAQGLPVVTTKVGAEGIEGVTPANMLIGDTTERIAGHICTLLADPNYAASVGTNGWKNVRQYYSWETVVSRLENIYNTVVSG